MEKVVILIPREKDHFHSDLYIEKKEFTDVSINGEEVYSLYKTDTEFLFILLRKFGQKTNTEYWIEEKLIELDKILSIKFPQNDRIIAIHWGGMENSTALINYILPKTDASFKLINGTAYLTFYSDSNDQIRTKTNGAIYKFLLARLKILSFAYLKKMIIKLWLPLAIDIQGLSEVQNDTVKADEYFAEVKNETEYLESLKSFPKDDDFPRWAEIRDKNGYKEFDFKKFLDALTNNDFGLLLNSTNYLRVEEEETEEIKKLKNEVAELEKKSNEEEYEKKKKELEEKMKNPNFLPNWLQDVVGVIDEKIKESSKPKD